MLQQLSPQSKAESRKKTFVFFGPDRVGRRRWTSINSIFDDLFAIYGPKYVFFETELGPTPRIQCHGPLWLLWRSKVFVSKCKTLLEHAGCHSSWLMKPVMHGKFYSDYLSLSNIHTHTHTHTNFDTYKPHTGLSTGQSQSTDHFQVTLLARHSIQHTVIKNIMSHFRQVYIDTEVYSQKTPTVWNIHTNSLSSVILLRTITMILKNKCTSSCKRAEK